MADDEIDELPIIRPVLKGKKYSEHVPTFSRSVLNQSLSHTPKKQKSSSNRGGHPARGKSAAATKAPGNFDRRVLVKARIVKMNAQGKKAMMLHINYIEREGVERDGSKGHLYGQDQRFNREEFIQTIDLENNQFRFIVSPEDAHDFDLTQFTQELMKRVQKDLGRQVQWAAVNHFNTDNPHTHIVIRGVDKNGQEIRIDREYISNGIRNRAAQLSTEWLGQRTILEIEEQLRQEVRKERLTSLDKQIEKSLDGNEFDLAQFKQKNISKTPDKLIRLRLDTLGKLGLAQLIDHQRWQLKKDWQKVLKALGERGDIIKGMFRELGGETAHYRVYDKNAPEPEKIQGRIVAKGLSDELYDRQYVLIESPAGKAWHVELDSHLSIADYRVNDLVSLDVNSESHLKPSDRHIEMIANANDGLYTVQSHLNHLKTSTIEINGQTISAQDFVQAHVKRLQKLSKLKLAKERLDGSWQVAIHLTEKLKELDQKNPQKVLRIEVDTSMSLTEQKRYIGRTWLDRFTDPASQVSLATSGLGARVREAVKERVKLLERLNIDPADPSRAKQLDRLQLQNVQSQEKNKTGRQFVSLTEDKPLNGVLVMLTPEKNGKRFTRIDSIDQQSFALVPWHRSHESLMNKEVHVGLNSQGRAWVKERGREQGRAQ